MPAKRQPTDNELALLHIGSGGEFPGGARILPAVYFTGSGTSEHGYAADVERAFQCSFENGTCNFRVTEPLSLHEPKLIQVKDEDWHAVPVIVNEAVLGIHVWRVSRHDDTFLEIFSPVKIKDELGLKSGMQVTVRLLSGTWL